jgi:hypothetical protein
MGIKLKLKDTTPTKHTGMSVIECRELARERYNPKFVFFMNKLCYAVNLHVTNNEYRSGVNINTEPAISGKNSTNLWMMVRIYHFMRD